VLAQVVEPDLRRLADEQPEDALAAWKRPDACALVVVDPPP
jgi:hypothetical protein